MMQTNGSGNRSSRWALGFDNLAKSVLSFSSATFADLRKCSGFDSVDQLHHDIVENADLLIVQAIGFVREQVGDLPEHDSALFRRAALQRGVKIVEHGRTLGIWHNRIP
jgi:hypothetical protein